MAGRMQQASWSSTSAPCDVPAECLGFTLECFPVQLVCPTIKFCLISLTYLFKGSLVMQLSYIFILMEATHREKELRCGHQSKLISSHFSISLSWNTIKFQLVVWSCCITSTLPQPPPPYTHRSLQLFNINLSSNIFVQMVYFYKK